MTHEITPFYHIISQRITRHLGNQSDCRESIECSQAIGKCQWEGNAHDFGNDEGKYTHTSGTDENQYDHGADKRHQHVGRAVLQAVKDEHHQSEHDDLERTGTGQRVLVEETDIGKEYA